jgi:hypothetical protein
MTYNVLEKRGISIFITKKCVFVCLQPRVQDPLLETAHQFIARLTHTPKKESANPFETLVTYKQTGRRETVISKLHVGL